MIEKSNLPAQTQQSPFLASSMSALDVKAHIALVQDAMKTAMVSNQDYGIIPGCEKPSLWKSGAEKLCVLFRLSPSFETIETYDGNHLTVRSKCTLTHINSGNVIAQADAICSTKEKKYAKRKVNGKVVDNVELPDCYNTVLKMADKRSLVACALMATAASSIFTQDMEDVPLVTVDVDVKPSPANPPAERKEAGLTDPKVWTGRIVNADAKQSGLDKFTHIKGEDGTDLLLVQPSEKDTAMLDLYRMLGADLQRSIEAKEELSISYTVSGKGNKLVCGVKAAAEVKS